MRVQATTSNAEILKSRSSDSWHRCCCCCRWQRWWWCCRLIRMLSGTSCSAPERQPLQTSAYIRIMPEGIFVENSIFPWRILVNFSISLLWSRMKKKSKKNRNERSKLLQLNNTILRRSTNHNYIDKTKMFIECLKIEVASKQTYRIITKYCYRR